MKGGIAVAGSLIVDTINEIAEYPKSGELTKILSVKNAVGGCVPNVAIDLKRLSKDITVKAIGRVGGDEKGAFLKQVLSQNGVDITGVKSSNEATSFTQVMSVKGGQRTFFTHAGASANFCFEDLNFDHLDVEMLHLGYFLLLDKIDAGDGERLLKEAKSRGIRTSIDLVSENSDRYSLVIPCLKYVDNLIINEIEAGKICGVSPTRENLPKIAQKLKDMGVLQRVIIHMSEVSVCLSSSGLTILPSYELPKGFIKGTTGAGDAFCAGALKAIYDEKSDEEILQMATISATGALSEADAISGVRDYQILKEAVTGFKRRELC